MVGAALLAGTATADAQARGDRFFAIADANGDGRISQGEMAEARDRRFGRADVNGDGFIDQGEIDEVRARIQQRLDRTLPDRVARIDRDGDGRISRAEFSDRPFPAMRFDANGDGALDRGEFDAAREAWRGRR